MSFQEMQMLKGFFTEWGKKTLMFLFRIGPGGLLYQRADS